MTMFCPLELKAESGLTHHVHIVLSVFKWVSYNIKVDIKSYMMDMKAANLYLWGCIVTYAPAQGGGGGGGGGYCDLCTCSKVQCQDTERIEVGFNINQEIEDLHNLFNELEQEDGSVKARGD